MNDTIRAYWSKLQGLDGSLMGASAHDALARSGWMRTVGGHGPYLGLHARTGLSRAAIDAEVASGAICELPSARGCTYLVPRADYAVALRAGEPHNESGEIAGAKKHLGFTEDELARLCADVEGALGRGPLDPKGLKDALGDKIRSFGEAGKKRGMTTTLPLALGRLQSLGRIVRAPVDGRLDGQRYTYRRWDPSPLAGVALSDDEVAVALAERFYRWIGIGSIAQLAWWAGLGKKAAAAAVRDLGLVPFAGDQLATPEAADAARSFAVPDAPDVRLVGSLDDLFHLRREVGPLVDRELTVGGGGFTNAATGPNRPVSTVLDLPHHAVVDRGRLIGVWDYDPDRGEVAARLWAEPAGARAAIDAAARFVGEELGDARAFSLDTPKSREARLAALRG